jgi:quercetin dioxygenase-like cupin family protein
MAPEAEKTFIPGSAGEWQEVDPGRLKRRVLGYGPELMLVRVWFAAGTSVEAHHHPHLQSSYILKGRFQLRIGEETRILHPGDAFYVPRNVEHQATALEEGEILDAFSPAREDFIPGS